MVNENGILMDDDTFYQCQEDLESQEEGYCPEISKAVSGIVLIAEQKKRQEDSTKVGRMVDLFFLALEHSSKWNKISSNYSRSLKTGNTWPWSLTGFSYGFSQWLCSLAQLESFCRPQLYTTTGNHWTFYCLKLDWPQLNQWLDSARNEDLIPNISYKLIHSVQNSFWKEFSSLYIYWKKKLHTPHSDKQTPLSRPF